MIPRRGNIARLRTATVRSWFIHRAVALYLLLGLTSLVLSGCARRGDEPIRITIWHQDRIDVRLVLEKQIKRFMAIHPGVKVEQLFKETEELRSGFIIAALAGQGPEIVYGPSDQVGPFEAMNIILPLEGIFDSAYCASYDRPRDDAVPRPPVPGGGQARQSSHARLQQEARPGPAGDG